MLLIMSECFDVEVGLKMECYELMNEILRSFTEENYFIVG